jgi:hypothetical protein
MLFRVFDLRRQAETCMRVADTCRDDRVAGRLRALALDLREGASQQSADERPTFSGTGRQGPAGGTPGLN